MKSNTFNTKSLFHPDSFLDVTLSNQTIDISHRSGDYYNTNEDVFGSFAIDLGRKESRSAARKALLFALQLIEEAEEE